MHCRIKGGNWEDNDKRTGRYSVFTLKIDNEIVGRSTATTLMHASALNASGLDELTNENADNNPYLTWEEADQNDGQLQFAHCVWERSESFSDADNDCTHFEMYGMAECDHCMHNMTAWRKDDLTQQPDNRLHIVMMDCGDGLGDPLNRTRTNRWTYS